MKLSILRSSRVTGLSLGLSCLIIFFAYQASAGGYFHSTLQTKCSTQAMSETDGEPTSWFADNDQDGYGDLSNAVIDTIAPENYVADNTDCNDQDENVHPGIQEICNGMDDDCNGIPDDNLPYGTAEILWDHFYGGTSDDYGQSMDYTLDGNVVIAGYSQSQDGDITGNRGSYDFWILKTDPDGNMIWQRAYGGTSREYAYFIRATSDSGAIVAGYTESNDGDVTGNHGGQDAWVVKLDKDGNLQWQKTYGGSKSDVCYAVIPTIDGGYALAGCSYSSDGDLTLNHGSGDYWIIKISGSGDIEWQKSLGGSAYDFAHAIDQTPDGGYYLSGYARSNNGDVASNYGQEDMWILKLDSAGSMLWQKSYGGTGGEGATWLQTTNDGGCILTGITHSTNVDVVGNNGKHDIWVVKVDANGILQWAKCYGGSDTEDGHYVLQTSDGGYLVAGKSDSYDGMVTDHQGFHDYWVIKLNESGSLVWEKSLGGRLPDEPFALLEGNNGSFLVLGYSTPDDNNTNQHTGTTDFWLVKCSAPSLNYYYQDLDQDGYGNSAQQLSACSAPAGYVSNSLDCNDGDPLINPASSEVCNGIDDDCDNSIDEGFIIASITPLATITICNTSQITFESMADSTYGYQWLINGVEIEGATGSSYTTNIAGSYSVKVHKDGCESVSPETVLKVTDQAEVITPGGTIKVCPKTPVVMTIEENPGIMYQWYKSSVAVPGATGFLFQSNGPGDFYVTETDIMGCSFNTSHTIIKNFTSPKTQVTVQGSLNICQTGSATLVAYAKTGYTFQWYYGSTPIAGATQSTYVADSAGAYKYLVTTTDGCTSFSKSITVSDCKSENTGDMAEAATISVFPNPAENNFSILLDATGDLPDEMELRIFNLIGQCIYTEPLTLAGYESVIPVNPQTPLPPGQYLITLCSSELKLTASLSVSK